MGWTQINELTHVNTYINERLRRADASRVHLSRETFQTYLHQTPGDYQPLEVWYTSIGENGKEHIALLLLEHNEDESLVLSQLGFSNCLIN